MIRGDVIIEDIMVDEGFMLLCYERKVLLFPDCTVVRLSSWSSAHA